MSMYIHTCENTAIFIYVFACLFVCILLCSFDILSLHEVDFTSVLSSHTKCSFLLTCVGELGMHTLLLWVCLSFPEEREEKIFGSAPIMNRRRAGQRHIVFESAFSPWGESRKELGTWSKSQQLGIFQHIFSLKSMKILYQSSVLLQGSSQTQISVYIPDLGEPVWYTDVGSYWMSGTLGCFFILLGDLLFDFSIFPGHILLQM